MLENYIKPSFDFQMEVFHPIMIRTYMRKFDTEEPPVVEEPLDDGDKPKEVKANEKELYEKYYKYVDEK